MRHLIITTTLIITLFASACKKDDPKNNDEEVITTFTFSMTEGANKKTYTWKDLDGVGGNPPIIDSVVLKNSTDYTLKIESILDETKNPVFNTLGEIEGEKEEHLFVYKSDSKFIISELNNDTNNKDFGTSAKVNTLLTGADKLNILLKHEPDKSAKDPSITGSTDMDITFPVTIK